MDFRGRVYPIPPLFSHIGNDIARCLLIFDDPKPLGERGLRWLKIQLSNLYGIDKCSFDERIQFVDDNLDNIKLSVRDPLSFEWWQKGDKPWMTLAACMELVNALSFDDPSQYQCRLPIHQDGSCNGLQHYAALGCDAGGARLVNLEPAEKPGDVYSAVAERVKEMVKMDLDWEEKFSHNIQSLFDCESIKSELSKSDFSSPEKKKALASLISLENINRKLVKQTVMTSVYGVTFVGARDQIKQRLKERGFDENIQRDYSRYITPKVFQALGDTFTSAKVIQDWLLESAKRISSSFDISSETVINNAPVCWTTPFGLEAIQPYRKERTFTVQTCMQSFTLVDSNGNLPVDKRKQMAGFPPNFIHSLDASHMIFTTLACKDEGINFAAVHDSYWTHACDVDRLRDILRREFIKLHSSDIIKNLKDDFETKYRNRYVKHKITKQNENQTDSNDEPDEEGPKGLEGKDFERKDVKKKGHFQLEKFLLPDIPEKGNFDINLVAKSEYFFN
jgi:DNA-directed RNA polymerase